MNKVILCLVLFLTAVERKAFSQDNVYSYKIEYLMPDNTTRPSTFYELMFNGHLVKANAMGMVYFTRENATHSVLVSVADSNYVMVGPSTLAFPEDRTSITTILLHRKTQTEQAYGTYVQSLRKLNISIADASLQNNAMNRQIRSELDSVLKIITRQYKISETELRDASEILGGREKYFKVISFSLEGYLNEAKDVRDIFKSMLSFSLENPKSFILFDSILTVYNSFYGILNNNNNEYETAVRTYWKSDELALAFHNVFDYAINDIHRSNILILNSLFNQKANVYIHEKNKKRRNALKQEIIASLNAVMPILDNDLVVLENKTKYIIGKLENERQILTP